MRRICDGRTLGLLAAAIYGILTGQLCAENVLAQTAGQASSAGLQSETPVKFEPVTSSFDYVRREVMIPMGDGVKLHAVIVVPKGAKNAPILLTRTPYNASRSTSRAASSHLQMIVQGSEVGMIPADDNGTETGPQYGYIPVVQDVPGKYGSQADYVM